LALRRGDPGLVEWTGVLPVFWPTLLKVVSRDVAVVVVLAVVVGLLALASGRGWLGPGVATAAVAALAVADLARAGAGLNPQVPASFFAPLPEMEELRLADEGRVFSYGLDESPAFRSFLARGGRGLTLAGTWLNRQILAPYSNVVDGVESAEATDLTSFVPRPRELGPSDYEPASVSRLLPWLRNAAVSRVLSLDSLAHPELESTAAVPVGLAGLTIHVYRVQHPWPRAFVACRIERGLSREEALSAPYREGFDPATDVALSEGEPPTCRSGSVSRVESVPGRERFTVEADGSGYLVTRDSFARGWRARVDGREAPVLVANGKHRAVLFPSGAHVVTLDYHPPGLGTGLALAGLSALALVGLWVATPRRDER
jgi:hypothetical protein